MTNALQRLGACAVILLGTLAVTPLTATPSQAGPSCLPGSLQRTLAQIKSKFGSVSVVSAHRPGARIAGSGHRSYHASCRAVDFNPPRGKYSQVVAWLRQNHSGGLGTYSCGMHHIHIDNGPHVRFHKCEGGGQRYASRNGKSKRTAKAHSGGRYAQASSRRGRSAASGSRGYRSAEASTPRSRSRSGSGVEVARYMQRSLSNN